MGIFWTNYAFYVLGRIECFLNQKNEVFKNSKISRFSKGVSAWFLSKIGQIKPEKFAF